MENYMKKIRLCGIIAATSILSLPSISANAALCSLFETVVAKPYSISMGAPAQTSSKLDTSLAFSKKPKPTTAVSEYGGMTLHMSSCSDADGSTVEISTQKRSNMTTVETNQWTVSTKVNLCAPNIDLTKGVTLKGDFGATLKMHNNRNREATYLFHGTTANNEQLVLFADKSAAAY
jgi:hypothetical protein